MLTPEVHPALKHAGYCLKYLLMVQGVKSLSPASSSYLAANFWAREKQADSHRAVHRSCAHGGTRLASSRLPQILERAADLENCIGAAATPLEKVDETTELAQWRESDSRKSPPAARLALLGPPPLLEGEDPAAYNELFARISAAVKPADILEEIWVCVIVDLVWEAFHLRRQKASLMNARAHEALPTVLDPLIDEGAEDLANEWARRKPSAIKRVNRILASAGLTMDAVMAQTLSQT
jgi:hypothetical protein